MQIQKNMHEQNKEKLSQNIVKTAYRKTLLRNAIKPLSSSIVLFDGSYDKLMDKMTSGIAIEPVFTFEYMTANGKIGGTNHLILRDIIAKLPTDFAKYYGMDASVKIKLNIPNLTN